MSATFAWAEDNGAATGSPAKGFTRTNPVTDVNWKNADDTTTAFTAAPITAGNNSFEKFIFGVFGGTFTTILSGLFAHTAGTLVTNTGMTGNVSSTYTTPSVTTNASLTVNMTTAISIGSGQIVDFGPTGPEAAGKASSSTDNPCYSEYLITQISSTSMATPGSSSSITLTLQYQEN